MEGDRIQNLYLSQLHGSEFCPWERSYDRPKSVFWICSCRWILDFQC